MIDNQLQIDGGNCIFNLVCFFNQNLINNIICQEGTISWWAQLLDWIIIVESNKESNNLISGNFRYFILASRFLTALSTYPDVSRNVASRGNSLHALKAFAKIFYASINCLMCWTELERLIFWWNLMVSNSLSIANVDSVSKTNEILKWYHPYRYAINQYG